MASTDVVDRAEFAKRLMAELARRFEELQRARAVEDSGEFLQATISLEFVVSARKKPEPEPCCVCYRTPAGIICSGDCCVDVIDSAVVSM
jgi:tRNA U54 and U55 pseudouridine synthase Pus10